MPRVDSGRISTLASGPAVRRLILLGAGLAMLALLAFMAAGV